MVQLSEGLHAGNSLLAFGGEVGRIIRLQIFRLLRIRREGNMARAMILGTAGHIDHGKTALVKALTGIDCDRLPEEKARGITIDIGFAALDLGDFRIGIVDLPGHERFIMNMLAGATGIDLALLVVAADDSVMPQTREHLEILRLLGLRHGIIALTKADLVDETTRAVVEMEIRDLVRGSFLEQAPLVPTSIHTGAGMHELRAAIEAVCRNVEERRAGEWFRMAIDRSFIVQGHGTIATGTVTSGTVTEGDELEWLPRRQLVRVRSLQHHDHAVTEAHRGMRAALNLAGVPHEEVLRGQELATPGVLEPSRVLTVRLHCLPGSRRPIKHRLPVRFHVGTAEIMATIALLDGDALEPGSWGIAQLFLSEPACTTWGQPFIVRESSAHLTLGGGQVLQPVARPIRRRHLELLEPIERLWSGNPVERVLTAAWLSGFGGLTIIDLVRGAGVQPSEARALVTESCWSQAKLVEIARTQPIRALSSRRSGARPGKAGLTHSRWLSQRSAAAFYSCSPARRNPARIHRQRCFWCSRRSIACYEQNRSWAISSASPWQTSSRN